MGGVVEGPSAVRGGGHASALVSSSSDTHTHTAHSATHARARAGSHPEAAGASVVRACVCVSGWVGLNARRGERLAERNRECQAIFSLSLLTLQFPAVPLAGSPAAHAPAPPSRLPPGFPAPSGRPADRQRRPQPRRQSLERSGTDDDTPNGARSPLPPLPPGRPGGRRPAPGRPGPAGGGAGVWWAGRGGPGPGRPGGARPGVGGRRTQRARRARPASSPTAAKPAADSQHHAAAAEPAVWVAFPVKELPHDPAAFTQGLLFERWCGEGGGRPQHEVDDEKAPQQPRPPAPPSSSCRDVFGSRRA